MARAVGIFCDNHYFPAIVPLINSLRYYDVQAEIKVYDHSGLNHFLDSYLAKHARVIKMTNPSIKDEDWLNGCKFRPAILSQVGFNDCELFLDSDMVALGDLEWPLRLIESGNFVGSVEWTYKEGRVPQQVNRRWKKLTGFTPPSKFDVFNGGLLGFNFEKHYKMIRAWATICNDHKIYHQPPYNNDQMVISGLVQSMPTSINRLPTKYWMITWARHKTPQKVLGFDNNGKLRLYEAKSGKQIQLYHYTGDVGRQVGGTGHIMRYFHAQGESIRENGDPKALSDAWYELWEKHHHTPSAMVADYMRQTGPMAVPKVYNAEFRAKVATLLEEFQLNAVPKRIFAICLAYDYITLLGYRYGGGAWIERPLRALLGEAMYSGDRVLRWKDPADVSLNFGTSADGEWHSSCFGNSEHLEGVVLRFS